MVDFEMGISLHNESAEQLRRQLEHMVCRSRRFIVNFRHLLGTFCIFISVVPIHSKAGSFDLMIAGAAPRLEIQSYRERQFARIIQQKYDFSCGSAALATLLSFHYQIPHTEDGVFRKMWAVGEQDSIRQRGFSLLDMKRYLESIGLQADGFKLSLKRVSEIGVPGIALIDVNGYKHFVVVKGVRHGRVLLGDPSAGLIVKSEAGFEKIWDGTIFFIRSNLETGLKGFNRVADWQAHPESVPRTAIMLQDLQLETLQTTRVLNSGFTINGM